MSNKNIWIFNQFSGDSNSGWGERHFHISKKLIESGYDVVIFSGSYSHVFTHNRSGENNFEKTNDSGVDFIWVKTPKYNPQSILRFYAMFVFMFRLFIIPSKICARPDYILVSSMPLFSILPAFYYKWKFGVRTLIFEIRDFWPLTPILLGKVSRYNPMVILMKIIERFALNYASYVVSVPSNPFHYTDRIIGRSSKVIHIPNGIEFESMNVCLTEEVAESIEDIPIEKFIVGYAGSFGLANSLENLIEAARILQGRSDILFILAGDGYLKDEIVSQSKGLENILFIKRMPKNQVAFFIRKISVGIVCWRKSELYKLGVSPNKYFDYMSNAKPIIIAGDANRDPAVDAGCAFVAKPEDPISLAKTIELAADTPKLRLVEMGIKGQNCFFQNHTYDVIAEKFRSLLQ